jgi:hypothetical protein
LTGAHDAVDHSPIARRTFTVDEANAALDEIRPLTEQMVAHRRRAGELISEQRKLGLAVAGNGGGEVRASSRLETEFEAEARRVTELVEEIQALGAQVKDLEDGLVDFPALHRGEIVLLCWRLGEDEIGWWHREEDGFAGRRPLPLD